MNLAAASAAGRDVTQRYVITYDERQPRRPLFAVDDFVMAIDDR
jgi:hypothetical protein